MNICVIGTGFVGVVSAAVYASFGHTVVGLDIDPNRIEKLKQGSVPFFEPGLTELLLEQQKTGHLTFTTHYQEAVPSAEIIIVVVGTPSTAEGQVNLTYLYAACESLAPYLAEDSIVVIKSTVPPGTLPDVKKFLIERTKHHKFGLAALPEFLKEGTAVQDTLHPDRIIIGATEPEVFAKLEKLHQPLHAQIIKLSPASAQMAKYASNAYLATRITFINQIADLCEKNGADILEVIQGMSLDQRIGAQYWYPGLGYGGSCFPKDVKELAAYSRSVGLADNLLNDLDYLNEVRIPRLFNTYKKLVGGWTGKKVAVLGLSFKPNTDDIRDAPSIKVIQLLLNEGAEVIGYDPKATENIKLFLAQTEHLTYAASLDQAVKDADVIIALIEWPEIIKYDFTQHRRKDVPQWIIDTRNQLNRQILTAAGYRYIGVGR